MLNALLRDANYGVVIGIIFTIVLAALVFVETPRRRRAVSVRTKLDSTGEPPTTLEEAAVQRMIIRVKLALEAAEKKRMVRVKSEPLVPDQVAGVSHGLSQAAGQGRSHPGQHLTQIAAFVEPPHTRRAPNPMLWPVAVHRMLTAQQLTIEEEEVLAQVLANPVKPESRPERKVEENSKSGTEREQHRWADM
jgi:hypothetical protein